jgi:hypothetical protein
LFEDGAVPSGSIRVQRTVLHLKTDAPPREGFDL